MRSFARRLPSSGTPRTNLRRVVVVALYAAHVLAARKTPRHPQKNAEVHRRLVRDTAGRGTERSVIFCVFLWMCSGLVRAHGERARQADPWNAFARGVLGGKYLIAVSARTVCARRIDSHPLSCRRCQEPPSTTCRLLDRLTLGGSRHRRRNDSRPRRAPLVFAAQRQLHSPRSGRTELSRG